MNTVDPSLVRYRTLRQSYDRLPADSDGTRMNVQFMEVPEEKGVIPLGCRTDNDPDTHDILQFSSQQTKGGFCSEAFVEMPAPRGFFGGKKGPETLVHLTRHVNYLDGGGYSLTNVALRTINLLTGELISEAKDKQAVVDAQGLDEKIPFRLHHVDPKGMERQEENWLLS